MLYLGPSPIRQKFSKSKTRNLSYKLTSVNKHESTNTGQLSVIVYLLYKLSFLAFPPIFS